MKEIANFSAVTLRRQLSAGQLSCERVAAYFREVARERDERLLAWVRIATETGRPTGNAEQLRAFPLFGLPIGVKDVIDTADFETEYGSEIYKGHRPVADAACVARILETGGVVLGKTSSTEFATRRPCATRNPLNDAHTPGGSSSGSAVAVAAGMVPLAVGTQTAGSVIRPASYCGIAAIKPTFGIVNRVGVKQLSDSVDTLGFFARHIRDLALITGAVAKSDELLDFAFNEPRARGRKVRLAFCRSPQWAKADQPMRDFFLSFSESANRRFGTPTFDLPTVFDALDVAADIIVESEIWHALSFERSKHWEHCSSHLREIFHEGSKRSTESIIRAHRDANLARLAFDGVLDEIDCLVVPSAPGEAPLGLTDTGPAIFNKIWTLLHLPCVTVPAGSGPNALPFGLQVIAKPHKDLVALAGAEELILMLRSLGHPTLAPENSPSNGKG